MAAKRVPSASLTLLLKDADRPLCAVVPDCMADALDGIFGPVQRAVVDLLFLADVEPKAVDASWRQAACEHDDQPRPQSDFHVWLPPSEGSVQLTQGAFRAVTQR